jgi:predicted nucleic acid-binding protein
VIVLDTNVLIEALSGPKRLAPALRAAIVVGERMVVPSIVLFEWRRGPRTETELAAQEALFPAAHSLPFGAEEAALAATLYQAVRRPRGREIDLAIAASAIRLDAALWTINTSDFEDIPGLRLYPSLTPLPSTTW